MSHSHPKPSDPPQWPETGPHLDHSPVRYLFQPLVRRENLARTCFTPTKAPQRLNPSQREKTHREGERSSAAQRPSRFIDPSPIDLPPSRTPSHSVIHRRDQARIIRWSKGQCTDFLLCPLFVSRLRKRTSKSKMQKLRG